MAQPSLYAVILLISVQMVLSFVSPEDQKACQAETGFDGDISKINFKKSPFPKEAKCFLACTLDKTKMLNEDGTLNKQGALVVIENFAKDDEELKQKLLKFNEECFSEVKFTADKCNNAFEYVKCKMEKMNM